ncbi:MAG: LacI family DNA-binding transcriptional regulator [Fimbriimonadaceae bacterium]
MERTAQRQSNTRQGITQRDIARLAHVSQSTVSRVLTGDETVDAETATRIRSIMAQHNYRPDGNARALRSSRSGLIGLVVQRPDGGLQDDPFFAMLTSEIIDALAGSNYTLCLELASESTQRSIYDELLRSRRVDGLLLVESAAHDERIRLLQRDRFPFVVIGNPASEGGPVWSVDNDNPAAAAEATAHLVARGYRRIDFLAGPFGITVSEDRARGYARAMEAAGLTPSLWECEFSLDSARCAATEMLKRATRPDAILALDDLLATGVELAARDLGLTIPGDLGLASFNDSKRCELIAGGLTSVNLNIPKLVRTACEVLLSLIEGHAENSPTRVIVPATLHARSSSARHAEAVPA